MAGLEPYKTNLWEVALLRLAQEQQDILKAGLVFPVQFDALHTIISESRDKAAEKWKFRMRHCEVDIHKKFSRIVSWVQKFVQVGDTVVTYDPGHAALPWAAIRLILQIVVNSTSRAARFVSGLEQVAFYVYDCTVRENLYLTGEPSEEGHDLENHILIIYSTILGFLVKARLFFEASTTKRTLTGIIKSADEVVQLLDPAVQQASHIVTVCGRIDASKQIHLQLSMLSLSSTQEDAFAWLREQAKNNATVVGNLMHSMASNHNETMDQFDRINFRDAEHDRVNALSWLSKIPYLQHHKMAYSEVLQGTGTWLFEDCQYKEWRDCNKSAFLWLHGIPGSGKSKLVSLVVEEAINSEDDVAMPLLFYCSRNAAEPERARAEDIARSLVKQLSTHYADDGSKALPPDVIDKYTKARDGGFAAGQLLFEECVDILSNFVSNRSETLVIIDALDECADRDSSRLIWMFNKILEQPSSAAFKLMISSRDSLDLATLFHGHRPYEVLVTSARNQDDINKFVKAQLKQLIERKRITIDGKSPPTQLRGFINRRLCDGAQGMFRWVSLQLDYISTLPTNSDVRKRLGRLPKDLNQSYSEIYHRKFEDYDPEDRKRLDIALSLLLTQFQTIPPEVFGRLVFWDGEEEQEDFVGQESMGDDESDVHGSSNGDSTSENSEADLESDEEKALQGNHVYEYDRRIEDVKRYRGNLGASTLPPSKITKLCFNLVIFDKTTRAFRFAHTSVQDYLQHHNTRYTNLAECHARIAERCISVILVGMQHSKKDFLKFPVCQANPDSSSDAVIYETSLKEDGSVSIRATTDEDENQIAPRPIHFKVDQALISSKALDDLELPWEYDKVWPELVWQMLGCRFVLDALRHITTDDISRGSPIFCDPHFIILIDWISPEDQKVLIDHTQDIRETAQHRTGQKQFLPSTTKSPTMTSASTKDSSSSQYLTRHDHWFFDSPPNEDPLVVFAETAWAGYVSNSLAFPHSPSLPGLEAELRDCYSRQTWARVRPWTFFVACEYGLQDFVGDWLRAHPRLARIAQRKPSGRTALHLLCESSNARDEAEIVKLLIDNGAELHRIRACIIGSPLCAAVRAGKEAVARLMLKEEPSLLESSRSVAFSPLYWAMASDRISMVRMLLDHGVNVNTNCSPFGFETVLHEAARSGNLAMIGLLLENGADINSREEERGLTPLMLAVRKGFVVSCKLLLHHGADVLLRDRDSFSILSYAVWSKEFAIPELLLESGIDINAFDTRGATALHHCVYVEEGSVELLKFLIGKGLDMEAKTYQGATALWHASQFGKLAMAKTLLAAGANSNTTDHSGRTPLMIAADQGKLDIVTALLEVTNIDQQEIHGYTALNRAAFQCEDKIVAVLLSAGAEIFPHGPGPDCEWLDPEKRLPWYGRDALWYACHSGKDHEKTTDLILEVGAQRSPEVYREALRLWARRCDEEHISLFYDWIKKCAAERRTLEMKALETRLIAQVEAMNKAKKRQIAEELGIPYEEDSQSSSNEKDIEPSNGEDIKSSSNEY